MRFKGLLRYGIRNTNNKVRDLNSDRLYTVPELALFFGVNEQTIRREIWKKKLKAFLVGREYQVPGQAVKDFFSKKIEFNFDDRNISPRKFNTDLPKTLAKFAELYEKKTGGKATITKENGKYKVFLADKKE